MYNVVTQSCCPTVEFMQFDRQKVVSVDGQFLVPSNPTSNIVQCGSMKMGQYHNNKEM